MKIKCNYPDNWTKKEVRVLTSTLGKNIIYHDDVLLIAVDISERITDRIMYDFDVKIVTFDDDVNFRYAGTDLIQSGRTLRKMLNKAVHEGDLIVVQPTRNFTPKPKIKSIRRKSIDKPKIKSIRRAAG